MMSWLRRLFGGSESVPRVPTDKSPRGAYSRLRAQALGLRRTDAGIPEPTPDAPAWGLLMETGYPQATATLFTLADGTASLYFSTGGGVIGGQAHETVRNSVAALLETANRFLRTLTRTEAFPVPATGRTTFYVLTDSGVFTASANETELGHGRHQLSPLFLAGHGVITELRLISEVRQGDK